MKITINNQQINGGEYATPSIDIYEVRVEAGFEASMPGVTINPWESEGDKLEF